MRNQQPTEPHPEDGSFGRRTTVMVADDDLVARRLICEIVAADDVLDLVGAAENADGAVDIAADHYPDVAVLDWMMPGGGGPEASRTIARESPGTRIIALTAFDTEQASREMLGAGAGSVLIKGTAPAQIARTIRFAACL
jgi:DNA-binding NarL/FixJ family response regulator